MTLGFNVPQSGPYADEGADELRAFELAVEHLNGGGDGAPGKQWIEHADGRCQSVGGIASVDMKAGEAITIETPGGGGYDAFTGK